MTATDLPTFAVDFYDRFGYDRPLYTLSHDVLSMGPTKQFFQRPGFIQASRENAARGAGSDDAVVIVFSGGDYDATRSTFAAERHRLQRPDRICADGVEAGVPIVPIVSIGGQETRIFPDSRGLAGQETGPEDHAQRARSDLGRLPRSGCRSAG